MRFKNGCSSGFAGTLTSLLVCAIAVAMLLAPACTQAATYNMVNGNSLSSVDPASTIGMNAWVVDGISQLAEQWWYYRIGETNQTPLNVLAVPVVTQLSASVLDMRYTGQSVDVILRYSLIGGPPGSGNSTIAESVRIHNKTTAAMAFHLFEYTDLNLNGTPDDDVAALLNPTTIGQWDGAIISTELASVGGTTPLPNLWEIANAADLLNRLNTTPVLNLADATTPYEGDAAFAFQWDMNIPAGATQLLSKSKILARGGAIGDTVWYDSNGDGIQDVGEPGIKNVTVNLAADFNGDGITDYTDSAVTDDNGYYLFPNLPGGQYTITIDTSTLPAGAIQTYDLDGLATPNMASITLDSGEVNLNVDFGYWQLASVGDRVWNDLNGNGIQDAGEPGINGVTVTITDSGGNVVGTAVTSGDGNYLFSGLLPGTYTVTVDATTLPAGFTQTYDLDGVLDNATTVTLAAGDNRTDVDFGYQQLGSIGDRVWNDLNGNGVQDAGEPGINGVTVTILDSGGNNIGTATTSGDGNYLFTGLPAGTYTVSVDASTLPAGMVQTYDLDGGLDNTAVATLAAGQNRTDVDFGYWQPGSIGDRVWNDLNGNGVQDVGEPGINGVKVTLKDSAGNVIATAITAGDGNYLFTGLPAGTYTVSVDATTLPSGMHQTFDLDGVLDNTTTVTLAVGQNRTDVDFGYTGNVPSISIVKAGPATAKVGDTITYHFKVTNTGNVPLTNVIVNDPLLGGVIWTKASMAPGEVVQFDRTFVITSASLTAASASVGSGFGVQCVTPPPPCPPKNKLVNKSTVTGTTPTGGTVSADSSWITTIEQTTLIPGISIVKTGPATAKVGDTITYHFKVTNTGNTTLTNVKVNDPLLGGVIWTKASMAPSEVVEFDRTFVVTSGSLTSSAVGVKCLPPTCPPKKLVNNATVTGTTPTGGTVTGNATWTTTVSQIPSLPGISIVKTGPATANMGDTITYHFKVTNTGNTTLANVTVSDPLLGGVIWQQASMAPGEVVQFDRTYVVKAGDCGSSGGCGIRCTQPPPSCPDNCVLVNTATATGYSPTGCKVASTSSCTTTISKSGNCGSYSTFTQGGWGSAPHGGNPGALLKGNFCKVYPGGCVSIGGKYRLTFKSACAIQNFLPQGGTPGVLKCSATNPWSSSAGVFAGQVLALQLNVDFSNAGITAPGLGGVKLTSGALSGWTIAQVLNLANRVLGGETSALPSGMTISQLNSIVDGINNRFDG